MNIPQSSTLTNKQKKKVVNIVDIVDILYGDVYLSVHSFRIEGILVRKKDLKHCIWDILLLENKHLVHIIHVPHWLASSKQYTQSCFILNYSFGLCTYSI